MAIYQILTYDYPESVEYYGFVEGEGDLTELRQEFDKVYRVILKTDKGVPTYSIEKFYRVQEKARQRTQRLLEQDGIAGRRSINDAFTVWLIQKKGFKRVQVEKFYVDKFN